MEKIEIIYAELLSEAEQNKTDKDYEEQIMEELMRTSLLGYSTGELEEEIERRKKAESIPQPISEPYLGNLYKRCYNYLFIISQGDGGEDFDHDIFNTALEALYGVGIWEWIKENKS